MAEFPSVTVDLSEQLEFPGDSYPLTGKVDVATYTVGEKKYQLQDGIDYDVVFTNAGTGVLLTGMVRAHATVKSWNSLLGKETIDLYNTSVTKGNQESHGQNFQKLGKDLMSVDELAVMDGGKCLLQIRGVRPFLSRKYDITKHPNYKLLSDFNEKNAFNIEKFLSTRMPMRPGERYRNYEVTAEDLASQTL